MSYNWLQSYSASFPGQQWFKMTIPQTILYIFLCRLVGFSVITGGCEQLWRCVSVLGHQRHFQLYSAHKDTLDQIGSTLN